MLKFFKSYFDTNDFGITIGLLVSAIFLLMSLFTTMPIANKLDYFFYVLVSTCYVFVMCLVCANILKTAVVTDYFLSSLIIGSALFGTSFHFFLHIHRLYVLTSGYDDTYEILNVEEFNFLWFKIQMFSKDAMNIGVFRTALNTYKVGGTIAIFIVYVLFTSFVAVNVVTKHYSDILDDDTEMARKAFEVWRANLTKKVSYLQHMISIKEERGVIVISTDRIVLHNPYASPLIQYYVLFGRDTDKFTRITKLKDCKYEDINVLANRFIPAIDVMAPELSNKIVPLSDFVTEEYWKDSISIGEKFFTEDEERHILAKLEDVVKKKHRFIFHV